MFDSLTMRDYSQNPLVVASLTQSHGWHNELVLIVTAIKPKELALVETKDWEFIPNDEFLKMEQGRLNYKKEDRIENIASDIKEIVGARHVERLYIDQTVNDFLVGKVEKLDSSNFVVTKCNIMDYGDPEIPGLNPIENSLLKNFLRKNKYNLLFGYDIESDSQRMRYLKSKISDYVNHGNYENVLKCWFASIYENRHVYLDQ